MLMKVPFDTETFRAGYTVESWLSSLLYAIRSAKKVGFHMERTLV